MRVRGLQDRRPFDLLRGAASGTRAPVRRRVSGSTHASEAHRSRRRPGAAAVGYAVRMEGSRGGSIRAGRHSLRFVTRSASGALRVSARCRTRLAPRARANLNPVPSIAEWCGTRHLLAAAVRLNESRTPCRPESVRRYRSAEPCELPPLRVVTAASESVQESCTFRADGGLARESFAAAPGSMDYRKLRGDRNLDPWRYLPGPRRMAFPKRAAPSPPSTAGSSGPRRRLTSCPCPIGWWMRKALLASCGRLSAQPYRLAHHPLHRAVSGPRCPASERDRPVHMRACPPPSAPISPSGAGAQPVLGVEQETRRMAPGTPSGASSAGAIALR
jgi:hypothetical protein